MLRSFKRFALACAVVGGALIAARQLSARQLPTGIGSQQPPLQFARRGPVILRAGPDVTPSFVGPYPRLRAQANLTTINVTYIGFTPQAQTAFQYAVDIWAAQLTSTVPIQIVAEFTNLGPGVLGQAGPANFVANGAGLVPNTWYAVALANKLAGTDLDPANEDIDAQFNSAFNWYFGTDGLGPPGSYDFVSVVLHELGHGLGFVGFMGYSAGTGSWGFGTAYPAIYDRFAINSSFQSLINTSIFPNPSTGLGVQLVGNNLYFTGPYTVAANNGFAARLFAPATWTQGSSYSHLDETTYSVGNPNSLMTPYLNSTEAIHDPGSIVRGMFNDMGWVSCAATLSATGVTVGPAAATGSVNVSIPSTCMWSAASNAGFVTVTGGASGTGDGTVNFSVSSNAIANTPTAMRSGTITIASQTFTVTQTGCSFDIAPAGAAFGSGAVSGSAHVTAPSGCPWSVTNVPVWASTTSGGSGAGNGQWNFALAANGSLATRTQTVNLAGQNFLLTQLAAALKNLLPGGRSRVTLTSAADVHYESLEAVSGRSYCGRLAAAPTAQASGTPSITAFRANASTVIGTGNNQVCFVAPATETVLLRMTQADANPRDYLLDAVETTVWANWFFVGGDYSSFTLLRNTSSVAVSATVTWRDAAGTVLGSQTAAIAGNGQTALDARGRGFSAVSGSVEVGYDGVAEALIGTQTTLSGSTGLSFDTVFSRRSHW
jgi:hypothetical protein